jgi:uncharacterized membrane protein
MPLVSAPESRFGRYWANQGLLVLLVHLFLWIVWLAGGGLLWLLSLIPFVGIVFSVLRIVLGVLLIAVALLYMGCAMIPAARGRAQDLPLVGRLRILRL